MHGTEGDDETGRHLKVTTSSSRSSPDDRWSSLWDGMRMPHSSSTRQDAAMAAATLLVSPAFPLAALPLPRADRGRSVRVIPHRANRVAVPQLERWPVHLLSWCRQQHRPCTLAEAATARSALADGPDM